MTSARPTGARVAAALEGSARPAGLAVARGTDVRVATLSDAREHASDLVPELAALLAELGALPRELEVVVVGLGPGSYTGLRVAAATALGLALGSGAAVVGLPSFEALAFGALAPGETGDVLTDAHGGHFYHARYQRTTAGVLPLIEPRALASGESRAALAAPIWIADDAVLAAAALDAPAGVEVRNGRRAAATDLLRLGLARLAERGPAPLDSLAPLYLRSFAPKVRAR